MIYSSDEQKKIPVPLPTIVRKIRMPEDSGIETFTALAGQLHPKPSSIASHGRFCGCADCRSWYGEQCPSCKSENISPVAVHLALSPLGYSCGSCGHAW